MKKIFYVFMATLVILGSTKQAYAANMVSAKAVTNGGQSVAECARSMDKGISECAKELGCTTGSGI